MIVLALTARAVAFRRNLEDVLPDVSGSLDGSWRAVCCGKGRKAISVTGDCKGIALIWNHKLVCGGT